MKNIFNNKLVKGTIVLTAAGLITRFIGFFFRIFLSRILTSEAMGLFQLVSPVSIIAFALVCSGICVSISKNVASVPKSAPPIHALKYLFTGLLISLPLSIILSVFLYINAKYIALNFFKQEECIVLIKIIAFCIPLDSIVNCCNGYYIGLKSTRFQAFAQLIEQISKVVFVALIWYFGYKKMLGIPPKVIFYGDFLGHIAATIYCIFLVSKLYNNSAKEYIKKAFHIVCPKVSPLASLKKHIKNILNLALPLTLNRTMLTILQSIECVLIPYMLYTSGMTQKTALSLFGILTGMALPLVFFPSTVVLSLSTMLLPEIASSKNNDNLSNTTKKCLSFCIQMGILFTGLFFCYGAQLGSMIFKHQEVCQYIKILAWLCPFMYINMNISSILHGLGKALWPFFINCTGTILKITAVIFLIPVIGIKGYLLGILVSTITESLLYIVMLKKQIPITLDFLAWVFEPILYVFTGILLAKVIEKLILTPILCKYFMFGDILVNLTCCGIIVLVFLYLAGYRNREV